MRKATSPEGSKGGQVPQRDVVLEELNRVLESPLFRASQRCRDLLKYLVIKSLEGDFAALKERVIGAEVFGRDPAYDTGTDAVVRVKANELRKRLALYYAQLGQRDPVRIDFPSGSYVLRFRFREQEPSGNGATQARWIPSVAALLRRRVPSQKQLIWVSGAFLLLLGAGTLWWASSSKDGALEKFWDPVINSAQPVFVCVPARDRWFLSSPLVEQLERATYEQPFALTIRLQPGDVVRVPEGMMSVQNFRAILHLTQFLSRRRVSAEYRLVSEVTADEIRRRAAVLLGAYHNPWALELSRDLRFSFRSVGEGSGETCWIEDRDSPDRRWVVPRLWPYAEQAFDYAIVSRVFNPSTGQVLISLAGINGFGTEAAAEFLTEPRYWSQFDRLAPQGWDRKNCQIVLETRVVRNVPSFPKIVSVHVW